MATNDDIKEELTEIKKEQAEMKKEQAEMKKEQAEMRSEISILIEEIRGLKTSFEQSQQPQNHTRILEAVSSVSFPWPVTTDKFVNRGLLCAKELAEIPELSHFDIELKYWPLTGEIDIRKVEGERLTSDEKDLIEKSGVIKMPYSGRYQFEFYVDCDIYYKGSKAKWYLCWKEAKDIGEDDDDETIKTKGEHGRQFLCTVAAVEEKRESWYFGLECPQDTRVWLKAVVLDKGDEDKDECNDYYCNFKGCAIE